MDFPPLAYPVDVWRRAILFLDVLRGQGDNFLEHERARMPLLLDFEDETVLDARRFPRPANYALLRATALGEDCWDDCVCENKPPVVVVDPRAGHRPGIGGFKRDSEVGMALHEGHPVYFVVFFPRPSPGQTLDGAHQALRCFVEEVTLLSVDCQGLVGPAVLNGSPLSHWAGEFGVNPMRVAGGLPGGAWLACNFENLQPERRFGGSTRICSTASTAKA